MKNIYYDNGNCTLIESVEQKCMYSSKYVFCEDCTRRNIVESHDEEEECE